jgi:hypothetical protein
MPFGLEAKDFRILAGCALLAALTLAMGFLPEVELNEAALAAPFFFQPATLLLVWLVVAAAVSAFLLAGEERLRWAACSFLFFALSLTATLFGAPSIRAWLITFALFILPVSALASLGRQGVHAAGERKRPLVEAFAVTFALFILFRFVLSAALPLLPVLRGPAGEITGAFLLLSLLRGLVNLGGAYAIIRRHAREPSGLTLGFAVLFLFLTGHSIAFALSSQLDDEWAFIAILLGQFGLFAALLASLTVHRLSRGASTALAGAVAAVVVLLLGTALPGELLPDGLSAGALDVTVESLALLTAAIALTAFLQLGNARALWLGNGVLAAALLHLLARSARSLPFSHALDFFTFIVPFLLFAYGLARPAVTPRAPRVFQLLTSILSSLLITVLAASLAWSQTELLPAFFTAGGHTPLLQGNYLLASILSSGLALLFLHRHAREGARGYLLFTLGLLFFTGFAAALAQGRVHPDEWHRLSSVMALAGLLAFSAGVFELYLERSMRGGLPPERLLALAPTRASPPVRAPVPRRAAPRAGSRKRAPPRTAGGRGGNR